MTIGNMLIKARQREKGSSMLTKRVRSTFNQLIMLAAFVDWTEKDVILGNPTKNWHESK